MLASILGISLPPIVALVMTLGFIFFLFRREFRERPNVTGALWLPLLWMLSTCTRPLSEWLHILGLPIGGTVDLEEGSPLDACFYIVLIIAGISVLDRRQFEFGKFSERNGWLIAFLFYCF